MEKKKRMAANRIMELATNYLEEKNTPNYFAHVQSSQERANPPS